MPSTARPTVPGVTNVPLNLYRVSSPGIARVVSNERLTPPGYDDVRHIVLDLSDLSYPYFEGQSLGVLPPGIDAKGHANKLRLYSIASTRLGDDRQGRSASLCVKRVVYTEADSGEEHRGVASNYLCDLKPGDEVLVTGPSGKAFLLPEDASSNLILVATGTGIAPFLGFLKHIYEELPAWTGSVDLFFGVRTEAECLYRAELEAFLAHPGFRIHYAFSREQQRHGGGRMYVQHRMAEQVVRLWDALGSEKTYLYICGLKGMEDGILGLFEAYALARAADWPTLHQKLSKGGHLLVETY